MKEGRIIRIFLIILLAVFVIHQLYSSLYSPITTQSAEYYTATDGINVVATIIRKEEIIKGNGNGALHFVTPDGSRVSKGGKVAEIYDNAEASITVSKIDAINKKIADIKEISGYNDVAAADLELVNSRVKTALNNLIYSCASNNFSEASSFADEFLSAVNKKKFITGETDDFSAQLSELKSGLNSLKAKLPSPKGSITAKKSGYFVSAVDGYETKLSPDDIGKITPEYLSSVKPDSVSDNAIGKIVSDYEWYIAAVVSLNDSLKYKEGDTLTVKTSIRNNPTLNVTVEKINVSSDSDNAAVILACQEMNSDLASMRTGNITLVNNEYSGLKLSKKSLRVVKGQTGVYVVSGLSIKFVKVNVIYTTDDYIVCEQTTTNDSDVLRLYDEVIVKGKNLYDGKIIN